MKNTFGNALGLTIFGESHGAAVGAVLDGLAAGLPVDEAYIAERMDRRRARGAGCGGVLERCGQRPYHRHPHHHDDPQHQHPQRRLCKNGGSAAPRPRGLHGICQI